ncbi:countin-1-like [Lingula anatina]|uniref:Countin-1-like n=1 Tax=Lingula anatina TaxID=7574 RepID=A0A1S3JVD3_LINAN|nr:countin-1-like [Lingula anatina]|eukprot:XP_013414049.1 countin-1-like [Lingula anatina]
MKSVTVFLAAVLVLEATALPTVLRFSQERAVLKPQLVRLHQVPIVKDKVGVDLCPTCVDFTTQAINALLEIILNGGVLTACSDLCGALANKTGSQAVGAICDVLCSIVGVEEFIQLIQDADLDPIYFCELITVCPVFDSGDANITALTVKPPQGPQGTSFIVDIEYTSKNGTGTGELVIELDTVDGIPVASAFLQQKQPPGTYGSKITIHAKPDPDCDPTQGPCEMWLPGTYIVKIALCNGECGSLHPHSQIYDTGSTNFTITG